MTAPVIASLTTAILFGIIAIFLSFNEEKTRKILTRQDEKARQKIYQIEILKEIQDRIGYSLDIEKIIDVITGSLRNLFHYSTASSIVVKEDKLIFKMYVEESVSKTFIENVKKSMIASLSALLEDLPTQIEEIISGVPVNDSTLQISSFFHIPLIVSNKVVGLINVSSVKPNLYKEEEMTILYQITNQANSALTKLQQVLTSEKGKLTSLIQGLADGVFMVDTRNNLLIINSYAKKFMNISKDAVIFPDIAAAFPKDFDLVSKINQSVSQNKPIEEKEISFGEIDVQVFITPVIGEQNERPIGASILLHNITVEKHLDSIKEEFTNMMVHELRAPATAIKDSSELIASKKYNFTEEERKQFLQIINQQSKLLLYQIGSILDAAKLEAGKFTVQKTLNDIGEIIRETVKAFSPQSTKKDISISCDIPSPLPPASFDPIRISQVIRNLLSNSIKFTPDGGKITISVDKNLLDDNKLNISVSDTGIGIPKDQQKDLFSKFSQVVSTPGYLTKEGSGLGLFVSKGIIEAHGGHIGVASKPGRGTTISFTLPVDSKSEPASSEYPSPSSLLHQTVN